MARAQLPTSTEARLARLVGRAPSEVYDKPIQQFMAALRQNYADDVLTCSSGMVFGEQTKYVTWTVDPKRYATLELLQITDVQFGHVRCKYHRVLEYRDWVLAAPNRFMIWTGDMVDAWAMWSPGRGFEQIGDPMSQLFKFCETWAPARHRILGYVGGNHERRAIPGFGDLGILLAAMLEIPYSNGRQMIDVQYGRHKPFQISQWHGKGGARTMGSIANNLERFAAIGDSQLYLMGHHHRPLVLPGWKERRAGNNTVMARKYIAALGSSFMETYNTYGEVAGFSMTDVIMPRAVLTPDGGFEVTLK